MIYTNDETDKSVRRKNFLLTVYVLPVTVAVAICSLIYMAVSANFISKTDRALGYMFSVWLAVILFNYKRRNWLKMPDGTHHNIKDLEPVIKINKNEPTEYEVEYFESRKHQVISAVVGVLLITAGVFAAFKNSKSILIPISMVAMGIFFTYTGIKRLLDKTPKLKLATTGLWTKNLGFIDYNDLVKAQVVEDKSGENPQTVLEIFLKGTIFTQANYPDEKLYLTNVDGKEYIEMVLVNLMRNRNEIAV